MASPTDQIDAFGSTTHVKGSFLLKEGTYSLLYEYGRHGRTANYPNQSSQSPSSLPVKASIVKIKSEKSEFPWRIAYNIGREVYVHVFKGIWAPPESSKPLDKQYFKGSPSCVELNPTNATLHDLQMLIGFQSGIIQYCDPIRRDVNRFFNEDRMLDSSKVVAVKWLPNSEELFLAAHFSGQLFLYNCHLPHQTSTPSYMDVKSGSGFTVYASKSATPKNPQIRWSVDGGINDMQFSPCSQYLALATRNGFLRVFSWENYELVGSAHSYFGGFLCVSWSPDSKFIAVAGEDDLVHVWSFQHKRIIARCRGHRSWVSSIAWDPVNSNIQKSHTEALKENGDDATNGGKLGNNMRRHSGVSSSIDSDKFLNNKGRMVYRFVSVGQDTNLCVWELTDDVVNQVLFPSKARGSIVIPADSSDARIIRRLARKNNSLDTAESNPTRPDNEKGTTLPPKKHSSSSSVPTSKKGFKFKLAFFRRSVPSAATQMHRKEERRASESSLVTEHGESFIANGVTRSTSAQQSDAGATSSTVTDRDTLHSAPSGDKSKKKRRGNFTLLRFGKKDRKSKILPDADGNGSDSSLEDNYVDASCLPLGTLECPRLDDTAILEPIICRSVAGERLNEIYFFDECVVITSQDGSAQVWARPRFNDRLCKNSINSQSSSSSNISSPAGGDGEKLVNCKPKQDGTTACMSPPHVPVPLTPAEEESFFEGVEPELRKERLNDGYENKSNFPLSKSNNMFKEERRPNKIDNKLSTKSNGGFYL